MKIKILILIAASVIVTLSFAFTTVKKDNKKATAQSSTGSKGDVPAGGFYFDEK